MQARESDTEGTYLKGVDPLEVLDTFAQEEVVMRCMLLIRE